MAVARLTQQGLLLCRKTLCYVNKPPVSKVQRNFGLSQMKFNQNDKRLDIIHVDALSRVALVVDKRYKTLKDVPPFLPYNQVCKARDKLRIKVSIATAVVFTILMVFAIKKAKRIHRMEEYEGMRQREEATLQK